METVPAEKKIRQGVSLSPRHTDLAQAKADALHGGNVSAYLRELIDRDNAPERSIPKADDERFLEHLVAAIFPTRRRSFARSWERAQCEAHDPDAITASQIEVADAIIEALLQMLENGGLKLGEVPAFCLIPGTTWSALAEASALNDLTRLQAMLREIDPSGALYQFRQHAPRPADTGTPAIPAESHAAKRMAGELHAEAAAKRGPSNRARH